MEDTVAVALITGGSTAIVGVVANVLAWHAARQSKQVELARIDAESERLRREHGEVERQHRQGNYHQFLMVLNELDLLGGGYADLDQAGYEQWMPRFYSLITGLEIFAPPRCTRRD